MEGAAVAVEVVITKLPARCAEDYTSFCRGSVLCLELGCWVLPPRRRQISFPLPFPAPWKDLVEV
jgi:hypothetical protein